MVIQETSSEEQLQKKHKAISVLKTMASKKQVTKFFMKKKKTFKVTILGSPDTEDIEMLKAQSSY